MAIYKSNLAFWRFLMHRAGDVIGCFPDAESAC